MPTYCLMAVFCRHYAESHRLTAVCICKLTPMRAVGGERSTTMCRSAYEMVHGFPYTCRPTPLLSVCKQYNMYRPNMQKLFTSHMALAISHWPSQILTGDNTFDSRYVIALRVRHSND